MRSGTVLVTGGSGLLGSELRPRMPQALFPASAEFDVTNDSQMSVTLDRFPAEVILHVAIAGSR